MGSEMCIRDSCKIEQAIGQGTFPVVNMRNDAKIPNLFHIKSFQKEPHLLTAANIVVLESQGPNLFGSVGMALQKTPNIFS